MADYIKKKIIEKLARFTRNVKPADISLSFLRGKGELRNLDLNTDVIAGALQLPPWISIDNVFCDTIKVVVPFTEINKSPIRCMLGQVCIDVSTSYEWSDRKTENILENLGSSNSSYGLTEKIIDGMRIEIHSILVNFKNPVYSAKLEISDVLIESTTPTWKPDVLPNCRLRNEQDGTVIIYKKATWSSIKLEGNGIRDDDTTQKLISSQLKLISGSTEVRVAFKRQISNCKMLFTRVSVDLGDMVWIVTQGQLKALSLLAQSMTEAAVSYTQYERTKMRGSRESIDSQESTSSSSMSHLGLGGSDEPVNKRGSRRVKSPKKDAKEFQRETAMLNRLVEYQMGVRKLPSYEVIQDSFHLKTGNLDLQLCDEKASLLLRINQLLIDIYLDQQAGSERKHWNKANMKLADNVEWSSELVNSAAKRQDISRSSVNKYRLRERSVIIRCSDFYIESLFDKSKEELLPIIQCDKKTFNLPDDEENPAFQCGITLYHYPLELGNKFLIPRPNIFAYLSPIHVNFHQDQCLWLAGFLQGVALTVNIELLLSAQSEGKQFLQDFKAKQDDVQRLPGFDAKLSLPFSKITLPLNEKFSDGRPQALQIETGGVTVENISFLQLLRESVEFHQAWERVTQGWFTSTSDQFPHSPSDPSTIPSNLVSIISAGLSSLKGSPLTTSHNSKHSPRPNMQGKKTSTPDSAHSKMSLEQLKLLSLECWNASTSCVSVAFVADMSHQATLYTHPFADDFPLSIWLFQPKKIDAILDCVSTSTAALPTLYVIGDVADPVKLELQHKQFLFLLRLKDSFQGFKNSLMEYLSLDTLIETQDETAFQLQKQEETDGDGDGTSNEDIKQKIKAVFADDKGRTHRSNSNSGGVGSHASGILTASSVEVAILLPTMTTKVTKVKKGSNTSYNTRDKTPPTVPSSAPPTVPSAAPPTVPSSAPPTVPPSSVPSVHSFPRLDISSSPSSPPPYPPPSVPLVTPPLYPMKNTTSLPELTKPTQLQMSSVQSASNINLPTLDKDSSSDEFVVIDSPGPASPSESSLPLDDNPQVVLPFCSPINSSPTNDDNHRVIPMDDTSSSMSIDKFIDEIKQHLPDDTLKPPELLSPISSVSNVASLIERSEYVLRAVTGMIKASGYLSAQGICVMAAVDSLNLNELREEEYKELADEKRGRRKKHDGDVVYCLPVIKARIELGKTVKERFFSQIQNDRELDVVAFLKASGLKLRLGLKNLMVIKDFFDDEVEPEYPVPLQIRIMETQMILKDEVSSPLDHPRNMTVNIPDIFINRGPRADNTNLIIADSVGVPAMLKANAATIDEDGRPQEVCDGKDDDVFESFRRFVTAFEKHVHKDTPVPPHPEKVTQLLQELQQSLSAPPSYLDTISCDFYSNVVSDTPHPTVDALQTEIERLRRDNQLLLQDVTKVKEEKCKTDEEHDELIRELVKIKMEYATLNLTHEKQLTQIERLVTEKTDLQDQLQSYTSHL